MTFNLEEHLSNHLTGLPSAPFLFVGSGFSRRYLNLPDWRGLLAKFCEPIGEIGYYTARANGNLPAVASLIAKDFNEVWWKLETYEPSRQQYAAQIIGQDDALKIEISKYVASLSLQGEMQAEMRDEISYLQGANVDGIITTNWDFLAEEIFPDYKVFVGQEQLLFANPQSIGEIYKIHGSADDPASLVLTSADYERFEEKNPYLAAKLITVFVEHPVIFLGYSITDPHIRNLIKAIASCLSSERVQALERNLIFVQRAGDSEGSSVERATLQFEGFGVSMTLVKTNDFGEVYRALHSAKRKMPVRLLRFLKEQLYEFVRDPESNERRLAVVGLDEVNDADDVEFVVGIGVAEQRQIADERTARLAEETLARRGYGGLEAAELFDDVLQEKSKFDARSLLEEAFPSYGRSNRIFMPEFRYLQAAGLTSYKELSESTFAGAKKVVAKQRKASYALANYRRRFDSFFCDLSTGEIIQKARDVGDALQMLSHQRAESVDLQGLREFLVSTAGNPLNDFDANARRKLICRYDRLAYGLE